ncbi:hypothetical protein ACQ4XT_13400 [Halobacillus faecis]
MEWLKKLKGNKEEKACCKVQIKEVKQDKEDNVSNSSCCSKDKQFK